MMSVLLDLDSELVAKRLRMYMGDKKLSRARLAMMSGINRTSLGNKLDGDVDFTLRDIKLLAMAIRRPWWWILTGEDQTTPPPSNDTDPSQQTSKGGGASFLEYKPNGWLNRKPIRPAVLQYERAAA